MRIRSQCLVLVAVLGGACVEDTPRGPTAADPGWDAGLDGGVVADLGDPGTPALRDEGAPDEGDQGVQPVDAGPTWTIGDPCRGHEDCPGGWCTGVPGEEISVCSYSCFQSCPSGWSCTPVTGLGPDRIFLCVPLPAAVCSPCSASEECGTLSVCVENRGEAEGVDGEGAPGVCLLDCGSTAGSCAGGFACAPRRLVDGEESREVCTPTEGIGCCAAATEGRQASCKRTNEHGTCEGEQVCRGRAGWTRCSARTPSDETCNSVDDDCDGETDEGQGADCSCGDGVCAAEGGEDQSTCPCDCHSCGDGVCTPCGESPTRCREDCCGSCGDGVCHGPDCGEDASTCAEDCSAACGNGACERGEDPFGCPEDCRLGWCGNGTCEGIDGGAELCPEDCAPYCGDCACGGLEAATGAETWSDCPVDCGSCGDGLCSACPELLEDPVRCPEDCCVATFEACNGRDDDCDGRTDEDFDAGRPCEDPPGGECFAGVLACDPESTMPLGSSVCTDGAPWPAGSPCGRYGCAAGYILLPGSCDGAGGCVSQGFNDCGGEACAGEARCGQGCAEEGDCRDGYACVRGVCTPARSDCAEDAGCIEGDPCTVDVCDRHGVCAHLPRADCGPEADTDGDGIRNGEDGCAEHFDPEAEDADSDGTPDACDPCVATAETETLCDGVDEDCDGLTDEDFDVGRPCGEAPDPCKRFEVRCTGTAESACRPASPAPPGTVCEPASCEGAVETSAGLCDAEGRCLPGRIRSCHPFDCSGAERCATGCAEDAQCFDGFYCMGGACTPKASLGERCLRDGACERGICADGVCCAEACEESCRSCALPGFVGQCAAVTGAEDPDSCAGDRRCDAGGECRAELGARCRAGAECETGYCADGLCCVEACEDSCRSCAEPGLPGLCVDVRLAVDADTCTGRFGCDSVGRCRLVLGQACVADEDCIAGYCVNGVCCQQRCEGLCVQCDRPGSRGSCVPRTAGTDPEGCRGTAACDGAGRCRLVAGAACDADGECMSGFCADGICCDRPCAALCRSCVEPASLGICKALTDVEQPALCAGDHVCDPDGRCVRRRGQPCFDASECATGHCVDGFCCDRACDGPCEACGVGGSEGTCTVRADGSDPEGDCSACHVCDGQGACRPASARSDPKEDCEPEEGCGLDGSCDGLGGCRRRGEETICGTQRCDGRAFVGAAVCDGGGSCVEPPPETCPGALLCDGAGSACRAVCTGDEACAEGHFCAGARCLPRREDGAPCATTRECLSGACVDGACCEGPCPGACRSCALSGREGECALSPKGQNPRGACGGVRVCDGEGGCASPGGERCETAGDCLDRRCADGFCCDKPCEGACKACNVEGSEGLCVLVPEGEDPDGDCPGEDVCGPEGECVALDGAACEAGADCLSGRCSDGLCCAERCARCHGCAEPGSEGTCAPRPRGSDPGDECEGALLCDGAGGCIAPDAEPCALGLECLSGVCADGLCCAGECDGACMSCALPGSRGRCAFVGHGDDPGGECTGNAACDGAGGCASPIGEPCEEAAGCLSGACADGVCCEESCDEPCRRCNAPGGRGLCLAIPRGWDFKGDCGEGSVCDGAGGCLRLGGQACEDASDCLGGKCVDGVCCDRDCAGRCEACDTEGHEGVCTPVPTGADPDEECAGDSVCGALGGCVEQQGGPCFSGLDCLGGVCADGVCCDSACDGPCEACDLEGAVGTCGLLAVGAKPRRICPDPFVCDALGECGLPEGVVCTEDDDCATGGCTDGVCCPGGCEGLCRSCAVGGFEGSCSMVLPGSDPEAECPGTEVCGAAGTCVRALGRPCAEAGDCLSGFCTDEVCCPDDCTGPCRACNRAGLEGGCALVPRGSDPDGDCGSGQVCDGAGKCAREDGEICSVDGDCLGGLCVDGRCCDRPCGGLCEACDLAGREGTCSLVPHGDDPDGECPGDGACDGTGACALPLAEACARHPDCLSGSCADGVCCEEDCAAGCHGCAEGGSPGRCVPFEAGADPDNECPGLDACDGEGGCALHTGAECAVDGDCLEGSCTDGACCDERCDGPCESCALSGLVGTCTPVPAYQDPDSECGPAAGCDGAGVCLLREGRPCAGAGDCLSGICTDVLCCVEACDGLCERCDVGGGEGSCLPVPAGDDPDEECPGALVCDGAGACKAPDGEACGAGGECLSGFCTDGVCCDSACTELCRSCDVAGHTGSCAAVPAGEDPDGDCPGGACDGAAACARSLGEPCITDEGCLSGHCSGGLCCTSACDSPCMGCVVAGEEGTCAALPRGTDPEADCPAGQTCDGSGGCVVELGGACGSDGQCLSGRCADGVCCDAECAGLCESCDAAGHEGRCSLREARSDPADECEGVALCDGAGGCALPEGETCGGGGECLSGHCADGVCCDVACDGLCEACGSGLCLPVAPATDPAGECAEAAVCDGAGSCVELDGGSCTGDGGCLSGHCVDEICCDAACDGLCEACDRDGAAGRCGQVVRGSDPADQCPGTEVCDGAGACVRQVGAACEAGGDCLSGHCADGVCCDAACEGTCEACDLGASPGACAAVGHGQDPATECPGEQACNGARACARPAGDACGADADCLSGFCTDGVCCARRCDAACEACDLEGSAGLCRPEAAGSDPEDDCPGAGTCSGAGECVLPLGEPCLGHVECMSGLCVDRVCCEGACEGRCMSCDVDGSEGSCAAVPRASDPRGECLGAAVCDGQGGCVSPNAQGCESGDDCLSGLCVDRICCEEACEAPCHACNVAGALGSCALVPKGEDLRNECAGTEVCDGGGSCVRLLGAQCDEGGDCLSGHCADGLCCDDACDGTCEACDLPGQPGSCRPVPEGSDPYDECAGKESCDGEGRCVRPDGEACGAGSECASGWCVDGVCCASSSCPGPCRICSVEGLEGDCALVPKGLDPVDACPASEVCDGRGSCVRPDGEACGSGGICLSDICKDGVCCAELCGGSCERCDGAAPGVCVPVTGAEDPDSCRGGFVCSDEGDCKRTVGQPCSADSHCISGACTDWVCCAERCDGACRRCDGAAPGACLEVAGVEDPDTCSGTVTCDSSAECKPKRGQPCAADGECSSGFCADGLCCDGACDGACEACDLAGKEGSCGEVPAGSDPDGECDDVARCDGDGACLRVLGATCASEVECLSGLCADGVCCAETGCPGTCRSCAVPGFEGRCASFLRGNDPDEECEGAAICDGQSACIAPDGSPCEAGAECESRHCTDGLCCDTACSGACESCALFGFEGTCTRHEAGTDPEGECWTTARCDGAGACLQMQGEFCLGEDACLSGHCADSYCCDTACTDPCMSCGLVDSRGRCEPVPARDDPGGDCPSGQVCDGGGGCSKLDGETCEDGAGCLSGRCVDGVCCDSACEEICYACDVPGSVGSCTAVPSGEDLSGDCAVGGACNGAGGCLSPPGSDCERAQDCLSGWCTTGVCCTSACNQLCEVCNATGSEGTCTSVPAGEDPADHCGEGGVCDGEGGCMKGLGTQCDIGYQCLSGFCTDGLCCDAECAGTCYACDQEGTEGECLPVPKGEDIDAECSGISICNGEGRCVWPDGTGCQSWLDCLSESCADGYCCDQACDRPCEACDLQGRVGDCIAFADETDPEDDCPICQVCDGASACRMAEEGNDPLEECSTQQVSTCGRDGVCDGAGACRLHAEGSVCVGQTCPNATQYNPDRCDGEGSCVDGGTEDCGPYVCGYIPPTQDCLNPPCGTEACRTSCSLHTHCLGTHYCAGTVCLPKLDDGVACETSPQCVSGLCVDDVCCEELCDGVCERCNNPGQEGYCLLAAQVFPNADPDRECGGVCRVCGVQGSAGVCVDALDDTDPDEDCPTEAKSTCAKDGLCGGGQCRPWASGTECRAQICTGYQITVKRFCDGAWTCTPEQATVCPGGFMCNASETDCRSSCTEDSHCQELFWCDTGTNKCEPKRAQGVACTQDNQCLAGTDGAEHCTDGVCCDLECDGTCEACDLSAYAGECLPYPANTDRESECPGLCRSCDGARACGLTARGFDEEWECTQQPPETCGLDGLCDGAGQCDFWDNGTVCVGQTCVASTQYETDLCDGSGTCVDKGTTDCSPYMCGGAACRSGCGSDTHCTSGNFCVFGSCKPPQPNGQTCARGVECQTGHCVDGVCCNTACTNTCASCALSNRKGTCSTYGANTDPEGECSGTCRSCNGNWGCGNSSYGTDPENNCGQQSASTCGRDGQCDGNGGCRLWANGTVCKSQYCSGSTRYYNDVCNGYGSCNDGGTQSCSPYKCSGSSCRTSCSSDSHCVSGHYCSGGRCYAKKSNGSTCGGANQCTSGHCVDDRCCNNSCSGLCRGCNIGGREGTCSYYGAGGDPDGDCSQQAASTCGRDGACNGNGGCRLWVSGTVCAAKSCSNGTLYYTDTCNGGGTCVDGGIKSCGGYQCSGTACRGSCGYDSGCVATHYCESGGGHCVPTLSDGSTCSRDRMCSSDSCTAYNRDSDGDGHGGPKTTSYCGEPPPGYVSNGDDCCESDPNAYPGQTTYFRLPNACNDYDYNCDGSESKRYPIRGSCGTSPLCLQINGWGTATIPACGGFGQLIEDCVAEQRRCTTLVGGYTWQTCR